MSSEAKTRVLSTKIEGDLAAEILAYCESQNETPSELIRNVLKEHMREVNAVPKDEWEKLEGAKRRDDCLYWVDGRCDKHTYEKGQFPEALRKKVVEAGLKIKDWRRETVEGLWPFLSTKKVDLEFLEPSALFCRDCRLWLPKPY